MTDEDLFALALQAIDDETARIVLADAVEQEQPAWRIGPAHPAWRSSDPIIHFPHPSGNRMWDMTVHLRTPDALARAVAAWLLTVGWKVGPYGVDGMWFPYADRTWISPRDRLARRLPGVSIVLNDRRSW